MIGGRGGSPGMARNTPPPFQMLAGSMHITSPRFQFADPSGVIWEVCPSEDGFGFYLRNQAADAISVVSHTSNRVQVSAVRDSLFVIGGPGLLKDV